MHSAEDLARSWFERVWNQSDRGAIDELLGAEGVLYDGSVKTAGAAPFHKFFDRMHAALSGIHITIEDTVASGDKVCVRWTCSAKHTGNGLGVEPTGAEIHVTGISIVQVENGKFAVAWQNWDMLGLMEQIKVKPAPILAATYISS